MSLDAIRCTTRMSLFCLFINNPWKTFQKQKKTFACALQNDSCDEIEYVQGKMWNPASANLTCDFIKMALYHGVRLQLY